MSTYVPIQAITLSSTAASVDFTGIPQTYTDLVLVCSIKNATSVTNNYIRFNGDTGTNYSRTALFGNGSTANSNRQTNTSTPNIDDSPSSEFNVDIINIMNYSNTTTNKTAVNRSSTTTSAVQANAILWRNTAAITSIFLAPLANQFASGSTFTLYGVGTGSPKAFGGDEVRTDGTYWYHIYRSSGRFEPVQNLSCDYLVVAGGGGGGYSDIGGGGGAGGLRSTVTATGGGGSLESAISVTTNTNYVITVGAGGAGNTSPSGKGSDSTFSSITSAGGGYGGARDALSTPGTGGSGGGAGTSGTTGTIISGGAVDPSGQGYTGGSSYGGGANTAAGGGGGGAGAVGGNAISGTPGAGGGGVLLTAWANPTSTGVSGYFAGGGGGANGYVSSTAGAGGAGGGGAGARLGVNPVNGIVNTGGGGGGGGIVGSSYFGGNGGSGLVIVRYLI